MNPLKCHTNNVGNLPRGDRPHSVVALTTVKLHKSQLATIRSANYRTNLPIITRPFASSIPIHLEIALYGDS